jgi:hypothetical protein
MGLDPRAPRYSPDGQWWWDGAAWRPVAPQPAPAPTSGRISTGATIAFVAGAVVVVIVTVAILGYIGLQRLNASLTPSPVVAANTIPCDQLEHTQVHYHAALQILDAGSSVAIPTDLGRTTGCYYWLHMHTGEPGIIHIEAPNDRPFTLSDFFSVWSMWSGQKELLDATHVSDIALTDGQRLVVYVDDGTGAHVSLGDPGSIVLREHEVITLEIAPPNQNPPPAFRWPAGF